MAPLVPKPVFNHDQTGELVQVRWNGDDRGVVGGPAWEGKMDEWFEGVRAWEAVLRSKEATLWSKMEMGTAFSEFEPSLLFLSRSAEADGFPSQSSTITGFCMAAHPSLESDDCAAPTSTTMTSVRG